MSRNEKPSLTLSEVEEESQPSGAETPLRDPRALKRPDWLALVLLAAVIVFAPLWAGTFANIPHASSTYPTGNPFSFGGPVGMPLALALIALAGGITALREWKRPVAIGAVPGLAGACVLMGGWATLSLIHSFTLAFSLNALAVLFGCLLLGGLVSRLSRDRNALFALLGAVLIGGTLVATFGIREYLEAFKQHDIAHRTFSSFANPDFLAGFLLLALPITLAAFVTARERMLRLLLGLGLTFQSACLLLTGSRAGIGMLLVALVAWLGLVALAGSLRRQGRAIAIGLAVFGLGAVLGFTPTLKRFQGNVDVTNRATGQVAKVNVAEAQGYSGAFRRLTWDGTVHMALANPLIGTGIGTYEFAYPRYAETAFTLHAHNGYLQWMAETGIPSGFFLLAVLAASTAFATHTIRLQRFRSKEDLEEETSDNALFGDRSLLLAGLLAGVLAALLHNLFDSDFYLVGTAINLAATIGLMVGLSRDLAPLGTQRPRPLGKEMLGFTLLLAGFLLWRSSAALNVRSHIATGEDLNTTAAAIEAYRTAAAADPLDGDPYLYMAEQRLNMRPPDTAEALTALQQAVHIAPTGKALYRLGQLYAAIGDTANAISTLERARQREPHNPQMLRALAKALLSAGKTDQAAAVYHQITVLELQPYGKVRAMPEMVETEFAYAHAALGDIASDAGKWSEAVAEYTDADVVMAEYWEKRNLLVNLTSRSKNKRADLARLYDDIFTRWQAALTHLNQPEEAAQIAARQATFRAERDADKAEAEKAAAAAAPTP